jgi:O-antigen/teichoic acid export membrane protein
VLLGAGVPFAASLLLSTVLSADGVPGRTAVAEFVALGLTVILLFALVPEHGGMGAAVTSAAAYSASFAVLARATVARNLAPGLRDLLIPRAEDARWMLTTARGWRDGLLARRAAEF